MTRYSNRRPAPRAPTAAQIAASEKAWDEALGSIEGRFAQGDLVADYQGNVWKTTRAGRRYHEDASTLLYPVVPARAPKEFAASQEIRKVIEQVLTTGTHVPGSRGGSPETQQECPVVATPGDVCWTDQKPNSYAQLPGVEIRGDVVRAFRPNYDDAPHVAWVQDAKLAAKLRKAIAVSPKPVHLPTVHVKPRGEYAVAVAVGDFLRKFGSEG